MSSTVIRDVLAKLDRNAVGGDDECVEDVVRDVLQAIERAGYRVTRYRGTLGGAVNGGCRQTRKASKASEALTYDGRAGKQREKTERG